MHLKVQYLGVIFAVLVFFIILTYQVNATSNTVDKIGILNKTVYEVSKNVHAFQFKYCATIHNEGALGIIVSSDTEKIPVQIDPNIQIDECQQYGTQIRAFSDLSLEVSLFYEKDMEKLFKEFDRKKMNLEKDLVHYHQKLLRLQDPNLDEDNLEEISKVKTQIELINHVIQTWKQGLSTLTAMKWNPEDQIIKFSKNHNIDFPNK